MTEREVNEQIVLRLEIVKSAPRAQLMGHCPYHKDKSPSMSLNLDKSMFHCFSCGKSGMLRSLYRDITGHSINRDLGIKWEGSGKSTFINPFKTAIVEDYDKKPDVHIAMRGTFQDVKANKDVCRFLMKRHISVSVAESMGMRYAVHAYSCDADSPDNKDQHIYFTNRLVIPIYEKGKLMSCEGREIYGKEFFRNKLIREGKNPDNYIYKKCIYPRGASTSTLYDIDKLDKSKTLYFVEGLMDLAVLRSDTFFNSHNSTTVFGASITERQKYLLKQFDFVNIIDNDLAGWLSLRRLAEDLAQAPVKRNWRFLVPPYKELNVKDVGDIPVKAGKTIESCRKAHWLDNEKNILDNIKMINDTVAKLQKEKKDAEEHRA